MIVRISNREPIQQGYIVKAIEYNLNGGSITVPSICLTPACDLVVQSNGTRKSDYVLFCPLFLDTSFFREAIKKWFSIDLDRTPVLSNQLKGDIKSKVIEIVKNDTNQRFYWVYNKYKNFGWVIDYQIVQVFDYDTANQFNKIYKLKSSYKERVASKYGEYMGRIGTQDIDREENVTRIMEELFNY